MDSEELKYLAAAKLKYYRSEAIRVLLDMIPLKEPHFALLDQLESESFESWIKSDDEKDRLWVYVDFLKAGCHHFCVQNNQPGVPILKQSVFVHKIWS